MAVPLHEIVILGGNMGGIAVAHYLLRNTLPALQRVSTKKIVVTVVSPNTHYYFKLGVPRAAVCPDMIPQSKIMRPLSEGFAQYPEGSFKHIQAMATAHDPEKRTVTVSPSGTNTTVYSLHYDSLFIAAGTSSVSRIWTLGQDQSLTSEALETLHVQLPNAKTVLIAGAGPAGCEIAGEISSAYPSCKITLLSGGPRLLPKFLEKTARRAQNYFVKYTTVEIIHNVRVTSTETEAAATVVTLSDGNVRKVDLYIPATGGTPNSQFLLPEWLDATGRVATRDKYFRVRGKGSDDVTAEGVYVVGDIVSGSRNTAIELDAMVPVACSSFEVDFSKTLGSKGAIPVQKNYKPMKDTVILPIGRDGGVGSVMGWQVPSWFVWLVKGRKFLMEKVDGYVFGS